MKIIDISRTMQGAPIYPGSSPVDVNRVCDMKEGSAFNASIITAGSHMGTHADAYCHFLSDNDTGIDEMELHRYYGPCRVVTVPKDALITKKDLEGKLNGCERVVLHGGGNSHFSKEAAEYIVEQEIITVVTDALSVAPLDNEAVIHSILLGSCIAIVENVVLDHVEDGDYVLCAFPIKIEGCDGAPVRAVLISGCCH